MPLPAPPIAAGTGKTVTLVECTLQLLRAYPDARLLVCAPQARLWLQWAAANAATIATTGPQLVSAHRPRPFCVIYAAWLLTAVLHLPLSALQNYSADLLCSALAAAGLHQGDMLRVNDPRRPPFTVRFQAGGVACLPLATFL